jgi:cytosine/adenosine deaminase-related metal-dependent hydrolase
MILTGTKLIKTCGNPSIMDGGALVIVNDTIVAVGSFHKLVRQYSSHRIVQLDNVIILPGLVNAHTHLELPPLLDRVRARTFPEWILKIIAIKKKLGKADYQAATKENISNLLRSGTTTVGEISTHAVSPQLLIRSGMRAQVYHEVISMRPERIFNGIEIKGFHPSSLVHAGVSPHAPYTVSERILIKLKKAARQRKMRLCMHVAESKEEIRFLQSRTGGLEKLYKKVGWEPTWSPIVHSPFQYLYRLGLLGPTFLAVHAVHVSDRDIKLLKQSRTPVAHCPRSNKETKTGTMNLRKFLDQGIAVGLGTDSLASSPSLNMWDEMRYTLRIHRREGVIPGEVLQAATLGGARALGLDKSIGTLMPGKKADLIAVPVPSKNTGDLYSDLIRETKSSILTMVDGKILYSALPSITGITDS